MAFQGRPPHGSPHGSTHTIASRCTSGGGLVAILESKVNRGEAFERQAEHWRRRVEEIREQEDRIRLGGGLKAQDKQRALGKMTARERVAALCDPGAGFLELGIWVAEGFYEEYGGAPAAG